MARGLGFLSALPKSEGVNFQTQMQHTLIPQSGTGVWNMAFSSSLGVGSLEHGIFKLSRSGAGSLAEGARRVGVWRTQDRGSGEAVGELRQGNIYCNTPKVEDPERQHL